MLKTANTG